MLCSDTHSCLTLCNPMYCSPPGSSVHAILQARIPEWVVISIPGDLSQSEVKSLSRVQLFATPWTIAYQAPPSMGFSRQEYRSGLPFPSPGDLPNPGIEPGSPAFQVDALTAEPPREAPMAFPIQGSNLNVLSPVLADGFFITSTTCEAPNLSLPSYKHRTFLHLFIYFLFCSSEFCSFPHIALMHILLLISKYFIFVMLI